MESGEFHAYDSRYFGNPLNTIFALRSQYSDRLNRIQAELKLTLASVHYIRVHLDSQEISRWAEFALVKRATLIAIEERLEDTYFIRLTAEFEGILKERLSAYYPAIAVPDNANLDWLISRVFRPKKTVQPALRVQIDAVRKYRNAIAHRGEKPPKISLALALQRLKRLINLLPELPD